VQLWRAGGHTLNQLLAGAGDAINDVHPIVQSSCWNERLDVFIATLRRR